MGKRKRRADNNKAPPPSELIQHVHQVDLQMEQRSSEPAESSVTQYPQSFMEALNSSLKRSPLDQNHSLLLRPSRHTLGRHYSRRNSTNLSDASTSNWKGTPPPYDAKLSFKKLERQDLSDFPCRESIFQKPERVRSSSWAQNAVVSGDVRKMECRICKKRLRKHPFIIENSISSSDLSVVAVLVCGHAYHADCLEQKTNQGDRQDPTCPLCVSQTS